jgi:hypothetical protein
MTDKIVDDYMKGRHILKQAEKELNSYKITKDFNKDVHIELKQPDKT